MALECERCGAPLRVIGREMVARCTYCGALTNVGNQRPVQKPVQWPVQTPMVVRSSGSGAGAAVMVAIAVAISAIGAGVAFFVAGVGGASHRITTSPALGARGAGAPVPASTPGSWGASSATCLVDRNGDGVMDAAGMSGPPGKTLEPTILDGATGKVLWSGKAEPKQSRAFCLSPRWFGVARADFAVDFFDVRNTAAPVRVMGRDKLRAFAFGKSCVELKTADGSKFGATLPGGAATKCQASHFKHLYDSPPGLIGLTEHSTSFDAGGRHYEMRKRDRGTPMLTVEVSQGRRKLWSKELPYAAATFSSALAAGGGHLAVFAAKPSERGKGILIGLDGNTGKQLYATPLAGLVTNKVNYLGYNGRYMVAAYLSGIRAYDPATGKEAWSLGL